MFSIDFSSLTSVRKRKYPIKLTNCAYQFLGFLHMHCGTDSICSDEIFESLVIWATSKCMK